MVQFVILTLNLLLLGQLAVCHPTPAENKTVSTPSSLIGNRHTDTLVFAHIIYRHGHSETEGAKQITNEGKRVLYRSGQYFHRRYSHILGPEYSPDKIYVLSTNKDRSIMSAQASLAGFFVPIGDQVWNRGLLWQPIPVHTVSKHEDIILHGDKPCPKHDQLYTYFSEQSPEVRDIYAKYGHLFPYWAQMSGVDIYTLESVAFLHKKLLTDARENKPIPDWAKGDLEKMAYIRTVNDKIKQNPQLVRLQSGFLIKEIFNRFAQKINGTLKPLDRVLWMYSAHSTTIKLLFHGLGLTSLAFPDNGCSLHWELFKTPENRYYVQLFYRKPDVEDPEPLNLPGVGETYTVEQFLSVHKDIIPGDFKTECRTLFKNGK